MIKLTSMITGLCMAGALSGCVTLLPDSKAAPSIYKLTSSLSVAQKQANAPLIAVMKPLAARAISGDDIVVSPDGGRIAYASGARWAEPIPNLVQQAAIDALSSRTTVSAILTSDIARPDYTLQLNLRDFEAVFDNGEKSAPLTRIVMGVTLTNTRTRTLVGKTQIYVSKRAGATNVRDIVSAQRLVTQDAMRELADWVEQQVSNSPA